jgi:citrate lyase beta subunit
MKTRREILEIVHDSVLEDMLRMETAIRNLDDRKDDDVIDEFLRETPMGVVQQKITKKDIITRYKEEIAKREHALKTIEKIIEEDAGRQSKT